MELYVLMGVKRIESIGIDKYNFESIYVEFMNNVTGGAQTTDIDERDIFKDKIMQNLNTDRAAVRKAFEHLLDLRLLKYTSKSKNTATVGVRLNEIHPTEITQFVIKNRDLFSTELFHYSMKN